MTNIEEMLAADVNSHSFILHMEQAATVLLSEAVRFPIKYSIAGFY